MADCDLEALSLSGLKKMQKDVATAISTYRDLQQAEVRAKVGAFAQELGFSLAELADTETISSRAPAAAQYLNSENTSFNWSSLGRKPQWFVEALEMGKTGRDLLIAYSIGLCGIRVRKFEANSLRSTIV